MLRRYFLITIITAIISGIASAQSTWKEYTFSESGIGLQLPTSPESLTETYTTPSGLTVPVIVYKATLENVTYTVKAANFTNATIDPKTLTSDLEKEFSNIGNVAVTASARVESYTGRQLSINEPDGSRSKVSIFFVDNRLIQLIGRSTPPDVAAGSGQVTRFIESLKFVNSSGQSIRNRSRDSSGRPGMGSGG